jgi:zinc/manganese transport system ATP-binding protein
VLTADNLQAARHMCEAFDDGAGTCAGDAANARAA